MTAPVRIGNCSGFYGDRIAAAREMVTGGPIDVLCRDYLAELTMLILAKAQTKDSAGGYARTFVTQMEQILATCLERGIKVVANAGGLNPAELAAKLTELDRMRARRLARKLARVTVTLGGGAAFTGGAGACGAYVGRAGCSRSFGSGLLDRPGQW